MLKFHRFPESPCREWRCIVSRDGKGSKTKVSPGFYIAAGDQTPGRASPRQGAKKRRPHCSPIVSECVRHENLFKNAGLQQMTTRSVVQSDVSGDSNSRQTSYQP